MLKKININTNKELSIITKDSIQCGNNIVCVEIYNSSNYMIKYNDYMVLDIFDNTINNLNAKDGANYVFNDIKKNILKGERTIDITKYA